MNQSLLGDVLLAGGFISIFLIMLCVGEIIVDHVIPHIKPMQKWLDSLPDYGNEDFAKTTVKSYKPTTKTNKRREKSMIGYYSMGLYGYEVNLSSDGEHAFYKFVGTEKDNPVHKARIFFTNNGRAFFNTPSGRVHLDEIMRSDIGLLKGEK